MGLRSTLAVALCAGLLSAWPAHAVIVKTFTVNTIEDAPDDNPGDGVCRTALSGQPCSLRAAVMEANHTTLGVTKIVLDQSVPTVYTLSIAPSGVDDESTGDLNVTRSTTIEGLVRTGLPQSILGTTVSDRLLDVGPSVTVSVSGVQFIGGAPAGSGGAILNGGNLTLTDCELNGGQALTGGGIATSVGALTLVRTYIHACHSLLGAGGGVQAASGTVTVDACTFDHNSSATLGGGLAIGSGQLDVTNSTFVSNKADTSGGGLSCVDATCRLFSVTVAQNTADFDENGVGNGGGVHQGGSGSLAIENVLIADNIEFFNGGFPPSDCSGTLTSAVANMVRVIPVDECTVTQSNGSILLTGAEPQLGPLANNGGPTPTLAIGAASNAANAQLTACRDATGAALTKDQRGAHRPASSHCDLGAYEAGANGDVNADGTVNVSDVFYLINFLFAGGPAPLALGDVNADRSVNVSDVFYLINFLFAGGAAPK